MNSCDISHGPSFGCRMFRRFAVLIFVLAIVGQASAGVCNCLGFGEPKIHSCCKRERSETPFASSKGCCETDCTAITLARTDRSRIDTPVRIETKSDGRLGVLRPPFLDRFAVAPRTAQVPFVDQRIKYARPPDLFLLHGSFLI